MVVRKRSGSEMDFESSLRKLEDIVKRLEEEEIPLETSLNLFAEGQALARSCEVQLRAAENQIRQLLEKPSGKIEEIELKPAALNQDVHGGEQGEENKEEENIGEAEENPKTAAIKKAKGNKSTQNVEPDAPPPFIPSNGKPDADELPF